MKPTEAMIISTSMNPSFCSVGVNLALGCVRADMIYCALKLGTASSDDWLPHVGRVAVITRTTSDDKTST